MLDYLHENKLKVFYANAYVSSRSDGKEKTRERHEKGYQIIDSLKSHPAIVAWYINDELPAQYVQDALDFKILANPQDAVCFRTYCLHKTTWLLAVNTTEDKSADFELEFKEPVAVEGVSLSEVEAKTDGRKLMGSLKPLQMAFIQLQSTQQEQ